MMSLREPRGADAARLLYADAARRLSDVARRLVPTNRDHTSGDYLREARVALRTAERLVMLAVVAERAHDTTWETIGEVADGITKQSAQKKWSAAATAADQLADGLDPDVLQALHAHSGAELAEDLDAWYAQPCDSNNPADAADRVVSGYLVDPGPAPDLSGYAPEPDDAYEWFLSDHPWARAERMRRAETESSAELGNANDVRTWTDGIDALDLPRRYPHNPVIAENLRGLADLMRPIADDQQVRALVGAAEPDDVRVARLRTEWITTKRIQGDRSYDYPARLTGPGAAAYPPPASGWPVASTLTAPSQVSDGDRTDEPLGIGSLECPTCGDIPIDTHSVRNRLDDLGIVWLYTNPVRSDQLTKTQHCGECQPHASIASLSCAECGEEGPMLAGDLAAQFLAGNMPPQLDAWLSRQQWQSSPVLRCSSCDQVESSRR